MSQGNRLVGAILVVIALVLIILGVLNNLRILQMSKPTDSPWLLSAVFYTMAVLVAWYGHWTAFPQAYV